MSRLPILIAAVMSWMLLVAPARAQVFNPKTYTLENGLEVVLIENHRAPVVTQMMFYKVGAADEVPGASGLAHLVEHLMFKGTETRPEGGFSKIVARNGGNDNAFTGWDMTGYFQNIARDRLGLVMEMEADRMRNLRLSVADVQTERDVVLEERRSRVETRPAAQLNEQMRAALFMQHPYGRPITGWRHELETLTLEQVMAFYRRYYTPNNAVLVVAGDITLEELKPLVAASYGRIPAGPPVVRDWVREPEPFAMRRVRMVSEQVEQASLQRIYLAPSVGAGGGPVVDALDVLAEIVGGGATARLTRVLVIEKKLAVSAGAYYAGDSRGPGVFGFYAAPRQGVTPEAVEAALEDEIAALLADGVTDDEVRRAAQRLIDGAVFARDSLSAGARSIGRTLALDQPVSQVEEWPARMARVDKAAVDATARQVLVARRSVTGILEPAAKEAK